MPPALRAGGEKDFRTFGKRIMKILVTGHNGYIGPHLTELLNKEGFETTGVDINLFEGCAWEAYEKPHHEWVKDVRSITADDLRGFDCVMHLAAISNDPMGDLDAGLTYDVNRRGTIELAEKAKAAGVPRFLFSSSCSIYGKGEKLDLQETDATNPITGVSEKLTQAELVFLAQLRKARNGDAAAYDQHTRVDGDGLPLQGLVKAYAVDGGADLVFGLLRGCGLVLVHPRVVLADVDHLELVRVEAAGGEGAAPQIARTARGMPCNPSARPIPMNTSGATSSFIENGLRM
jgi:hypothetical protein